MNLHVLNRRISFKERRHAESAFVPFVVGKEWHVKHD